MKRFILLTAAILLSFSQAFAAGKPCEKLKDEIATKLTSKRVRNYELTIVASDAVSPAGKIVGRCEDGSKKIIYSKQVETKKDAQLGSDIAILPPSAKPTQEPITPLQNDSTSPSQHVPVVAVQMIEVGQKPVVAISVIKSCEELKAEIEAKLSSKGVKAYELTIVAKSAATTGKVVGYCESNAKKIIYNRK
jgi:hypothetical protein